LDAVIPGAFGSDASVLEFGTDEGEGAGVISEGALAVPRAADELAPMDPAAPGELAAALEPP